MGLVRPARVFGGDSVGGPLRALLEKVDAEVGEAGDYEFDLFR